MEEMLKAILSSPGAISALFNEYKPIIYGVLQEAFNCYKDLVNNDEYFTVCAQFYKKKYDALVEAGFTKAQAMAIMLDETKRTKEYITKTSSTGVSLKG